MVSYIFESSYFFSFFTFQGFFQLLEPKVTVRCRQQDVELVQVRLRTQVTVIKVSAYLLVCVITNSIVFYTVIVFFVCFFASQAAIDKNIPIYKEAVKSNIVVKIDQERFLPAET